MSKDIIFFPPTIYRKIALLQLNTNFPDTYICIVYTARERIKLKNNIKIVHHVTKNISSVEIYFINQHKYIRRIFKSEYSLVRNPNMKSVLEKQSYRFTRVSHFTFNYGLNRKTGPKYVRYICSPG